MAKMLSLHPRASGRADDDYVRAHRLDGEYGQLLDGLLFVRVVSYYDDWITMELSQRAVDIAKRYTNSSTQGSSATWTRAIFEVLERHGSDAACSSPLLQLLADGFLCYGRVKADSICKAYQQLAPPACTTRLTGNAQSDVEY